MRTSLVAVSVIGALLFPACKADDPPVDDGVDLLSHVDPFIGTGGFGFGVGSTYPGPTLPFAMIHPGPDTRAPGGAPGFNHCAGYWWEDPLVEAFSLLRMNGTGVPDYGIVGLMPVNGMDASRTTESGHSTPFSHDDEEATPGYYRVRMEDGIQVEITSTLRTAIFRIEFPAEGFDPVLLLDLEHTIGGGVSTGGSVSVDTTLSAFDGMLHYEGDLTERLGGFDLFARGELDTTPTETGVWDETGLRPGESTASGVDLGAWFRFPAGTTTVHLRVAVSFVDAAGAAGNLAAEAPDFDFEAMRGAAVQQWREELSVVELHGVAERDATLIATALYHALLMPTLMSDVDGRVRDADGNITTSPGARYSDFSLWDTYRTLHPWLLLAEDRRNEEFAASLYAFAVEGGAYPRWSIAFGDSHTMIGSPADMVMAESALKGVPLEDEEAAFQYALATAWGPAPGAIGGRGAVEDYITYGYVPDDLHGGSVSRTLEYAIADDTIAGWARRLGHDSDAADMDAHADSWLALFDAQTGFIRPKRSTGEWSPSWTGPLQAHAAFTEGDAWQYLWLVPNDLAGLAEALGGTDAALMKLRELFEASAKEKPLAGLRAYYWHGNEPDIMAPWIFAAWGEPGEASIWIDWVVDEMYGTGPDGLPGNDDGGTLSAWLLFAAAGIYPIAGTERYIVAAPRHPLLVLHRPSGDLRVEADPDPATNPIPLSVTLDGEPVVGNWLLHNQLVGAHTLHFTMGK